MVKIEAIIGLDVFLSDGDELIAKRIEKSAKEIEIERIENEMRKLADDLRKVKGE